jgi:hypothetical protein
MPSSVCFCIEVGKFWPTGSVYYEQLAYVADKIKTIYSVLADSVVF